MNKRVHSYESLQEEKLKLEALLAAQRQVIEYDLADLQEKLEPVISTVTAAGKVLRPAKDNPLLGSVTRTAVDIVLNGVLPARMGWFKRLAIPFVAKNLTSNYVTKHKDSIRHKLLSVFGRKNGKHTGPATADHSVN